MNKEQYVTYETAELLKEKGFDWFTYTYYTKDDVDEKPYFGRESLCSDNWNGQVGEVNDLWFSAPTQQMAMRWLWEEKGLNVNAIYGDYPALEKSFWMPQIDSLNGCYGVDDEDFFREYDSREDCIEAALEYCLKNIIK